MCVFGCMINLLALGWVAMFCALRPLLEEKKKRKSRQEVCCCGVLLCLLCLVSYPKKRRKTYGTLGERVGNG